MKTRFLIISGVLVASVLALMLNTGDGKRDSIIVVDTIKVAATPAKYTGEELRMRGFVKTGSILRYGNKADFIVEQEGSEIPVHFNGDTILPDTFADGAPVRVDGQLLESGANPKLLATKVEAKCASKYEADYAEGARPATAPLHPDAIPMNSAKPVKISTNPATNARARADY
ncbi:MAG: cytochrome c maturation protein CcmE [bacterium]|nr:cytochrome c maturation protein CcmE [bacterium]